MRNFVLFGAFFMLAIGAFFFNGMRPTAHAQSGAGSVMMTIEVAGEANGLVTIELLADVAPLHVAQISTLAKEGKYDGVVFHRVIDGFMAQTGDVQYGLNGGDTSYAGRGGSDYDNIQAEFSEIAFDRGVVGMARSQNPNSANSQFFIMFDAGHFLNGQYTVFGRVTEGMDVVDAIKLGLGPNGAVIGAPDYMAKVTIAE
ncbi:peptidyl-prolyl cis-trans isomerase, cyclophilin-type [Rhodobacterales bacterium HTCC2150]|nr:peptidyl-prolyl cis-trans isomerase, cyclophilin-type [Rhodobacterales bacterium HTCC2150] [Rhodobacteraceae bacterium HTCC2150]